MNLPFQLINEYQVYKYRDGIGNSYYKIRVKKWWFPIYVSAFLEFPDEYNTFIEAQLIIDEKMKDALIKQRICVGVAHKELLPENYKISVKLTVDEMSLIEITNKLNEIFDTNSGSFNLMHSDLKPEYAELIVKRSFSEDKPKMDSSFSHLEYCDAAIALLSVEVLDTSDFSVKLSECIMKNGKVVK
jgi:hypothetical protein